MYSMDWMIFCRGFRKGKNNLRGSRTRHLWELPFVASKRKFPLRRSIRVNTDGFTTRNDQLHVCARWEKKTSLRTHGCQRNVMMFDHLPNELCTDDLPNSFDLDDRLVDLLVRIKKNVVAKGVVAKDVVAELAEEAGISETAIDRARQIEAAPPEVQQQIDSLLQKQEMSQENRDSGPYHEALSDAFSAPGRGTSSDGGENGGLSQDPSRRRRKTQEDIATAIENEGKPGGKFSFTICKKWKSKNDQVRVAFAEWYGGRCQICDKTFIQQSGEPYFEGVYLVSRTNAGWLDREGNCSLPLRSA